MFSKDPIEKMFNDKRPLTEFQRYLKSKRENTLYYRIDKKNQLYLVKYNSEGGIFYFYLNKIEL